MKNILLAKFSILFIALVFCSVDLSAQAIAPCPGYTDVAKNCVGACGNPTSLTYTVTSPCSAILVPMCLRNASSSLCPSHQAYATIYVNGAPVANGNITPVGSNITFNALCGSTVTVVVVAVQQVGGIQCVWLGNLKYVLSRN